VGLQATTKVDALAKADSSQAMPAALAYSQAKALVGVALMEKTNTPAIEQPYVSESDLIRFRHIGRAIWGRPYGGVHIGAAIWGGHIGAAIWGRPYRDGHIGAARWEQNRSKLMSFIYKGMNRTIMDLTGAAGRSQKQALATSTCAAGMETPGGPVVLRRARTAEERQYVVNVTTKNWKRVGQVPRKHLLMWDTADGSPPADAQLTVRCFFRRSPPIPRYHTQPRITPRRNALRRASPALACSRRPRLPRIQQQERDGRPQPCGRRSLRCAHLLHSWPHKMPVGVTNVTWGARVPPRAQHFLNAARALVWLRCRGDRDAQDDRVAWRAVQRGTWRGPHLFRCPRPHLLPSAAK
jgi:hypothetical protein